MAATAPAAAGAAEGGSCDVQRSLDASAVDSLATFHAALDQSSQSLKREEGRLRDLAVSLRAITAENSRLRGDVLRGQQQRLAALQAEGARQAALLRSQQVALKDIEEEMEGKRALRRQLEARQKTTEQRVTETQEEFVRTSLDLQRSVMWLLQPPLALSPAGMEALTAMFAAQAPPSNADGVLPPSEDLERLVEAPDALLPPPVAFLPALQSAVSAGEEQTAVLQRDIAALREQLAVVEEQRQQCERECAAERSRLGVDMVGHAAADEQGPAWPLGRTAVRERRAAGGTDERRGAEKRLELQQLQTAQREVREAGERELHALQARRTEARDQVRRLCDELEVADHEQQQVERDLDEFVNSTTRKLATAVPRCVACGADVGASLPLRRGQGG